MDGGLLGPLTGHGHRQGHFGGGGVHCQGDYGPPPQYHAGPKTSLMEVFNRVSSMAAGGVMHSLIPGVAEMSKSFTKACSGTPALEVPSGRSSMPGYEAGVIKGGTATVPGDAGQDHGKATCAPGEATSCLLYTSPSPRDA